MALDETRNNDYAYDINGFKYVVDQDLMKKASDITIDFTMYGFQINSNLEMDKSSCSSCSTGSCG